MIDDATDPEAFFAAHATRHVDWSDDFTPSRDTAWHEAGHIVAGLLQGRRPYFAYINEARAGVTVLSGVSWHLPRLDMRVDIEGMLAGDLAMGLHSNFQHRPYDKELRESIWKVRVGRQCPDDQMKVLTYLIEVFGMDDDAIVSAYRAAEERTIEMLDRLDVRRALRAIADLLIEHRRFSGEGVTEIASLFITPAPQILERTTFQ